MNAQEFEIVPLGKSVMLFPLVLGLLLPMVSLVRPEALLQAMQRLRDDSSRGAR